MRAVDDFPATCAQALADGVGGFKILIPPELDALGEKLLSGGAV
jgi:hypothetical protein